MSSPGPAAGTERGAPRRITADQNLLVLALVLVAALGWGLMFVGHAWHGGLSHAAVPETSLPETVVPETDMPESTGPESGAGVHQHHGEHRYQPAPAPQDEAAGAATAVGGLAAVGGVAAVGGWAVMVVAMMVPPALPMFRTLQRLVSSRPGRTGLVALSLLVFTAMWTVVGAALLGGAALLERAMTARPWLAERSTVVAGAVLVAAGVYQFTPLKNACLRACRSPRAFVVAHWHGRRPAAAETTVVTGAYTLSCIGCCWALMAVCLVVGAAALPAMVALAAVMAAERLVPWGRVLARPVGALLLVSGVALAGGVVPARLLTG